MSDYSECKMYIILDDDDNCYIGHTVQTLERRLQVHHNPYNACSSSQLMPNNPTIELLEDYPCKDKEEACHREQYWMDQFPNRINKINAIADPDSTYKYNRSNARKAVSKKYNDKIPPYTCECGVVIAKNTKSQVNRHKKSKKHLDRLSGWTKPPYTCECGSIIKQTLPNKIKRHEQSKKHINYNLSQLHKDEPHL